MERSAHLYLDKNKECDTLKMEILQLEENVYLQKVELGRLKDFERYDFSVIEILYVFFKVFWISAVIEAS